MNTTAKITVWGLLVVVAVCIVFSLQFGGAANYLNEKGAFYRSDHPANVACGTSEVNFVQQGIPSCVQTLGTIGDVSAWVAVSIWVSLAVWGIVLIARKGYISAIGCGLTFILLGGWAILLALALGPITIGVALLLKAKRRCPYCKEWIPADATRCSKCHGDLAALS